MYPARVWLIPPFKLSINASTTFPPHEALELFLDKLASSQLSDEGSCSWYLAVIGGEYESLGRLLGPGVGVDVVADVLLLAALVVVILGAADHLAAEEGHVDGAREDYRKEVFSHP